MNILPDMVCKGVGTVIRAKLPSVCVQCGASDSFRLDYKARYIPNATGYLCKKCQAVEYVNASTKGIIA